MRQGQPITRRLGATERTLRALLETKIAPANLSFPEWATLTILSGVETLPDDRLSAAILNGKVAAANEIPALYDTLQRRGLIARADGVAAMTPAGRALHEPILAEVTRVVAWLEEGLSDSDLAATRSVLEHIAARADEALSSS